MYSQNARTLIWNIVEGSDFSDTAALVMYRLWSQIHFSVKISSQKIEMLGEMWNIQIKCFDNFCDLVRFAYARQYNDVLFSVVRCHVSTIRLIVCL